MGLFFRWAAPVISMGAAHHCGSPVFDGLRPSLVNIAPSALLLVGLAFLFDGCGSSRWAVTVVGGYRPFSALCFLSPEGAIICMHRAKPYEKYCNFVSPEGAISTTTGCSPV